jgi:hypothetical protein
MGIRYIRNRDLSYRYEGCSENRSFLSLQIRQFLFICLSSVLRNQRSSPPKVDLSGFENDSTFGDCRLALRV